MSPILKDTEKAGVRAVRRKRNPLDITPRDFFTESDLLRAEFAKLINVKDSTRVAIIPSVSYGIATVAKNLNISRGQNIIVAGEQFPSNYYSWQALAEENGANLKSIAPEKTTTDRGKKWNEKILSEINADTRAVAIPHTHWADGTKFQLAEIRKRTREVGALLIIDGTQSVGALPFDVQEIQPDALICAGYKWLLGPYSIGLAYFGEHFNDGKPLEENWINRSDSENFSGLVNYQHAYQPGALRYEVGEHSNFILVPMLLKSIAQLNRWGVDNVQKYCESITEDSIEHLRNFGCWIEEKEFRGSHLIGVRLPDIEKMEIVKQSLVKNNIHVSYRGDAIRVAPNVYNTEAQMRKFTKVVSAAIK
ncbi:MAG TPA: aminotransferase class V-fold PLP-dependent enzyme [Chryseosolibacter sp.]|nr:aminotransferase class V-fold PLP-dependent enzyme [Chryseosolibacter sp.]